MSNVNMEVDLDEDTICKLIENYVLYEGLFSGPSIEVFNEHAKGNDPHINMDTFLMAAGKAVLNESMLIAITAAVELAQTEQELKQDLKEGESDDVTTE